LAVVGVLALGDYLLWNWSLGANRDVVALIAGVTLIPLLIALAWLLVLTAVRSLASFVQRPRAGAVARARVGPRAAGRSAGPTAGRAVVGESLTAAGRVVEHANAEPAYAAEGSATDHVPVGATQATASPPSQLAA
jgi:hypothetical protein